TPGYGSLPREPPMLSLGLSVFLLAAPPQPLPLGAAIADFTLGDARGATVRLTDYADRDVVVVVFLAVDCPLAKLYGPRLADLARTYAPRGVAFLAVDANQADSATAIAQYART